MSHTHRRNYAPEIPNPDPSITTVQNISNHFSRLYLNHKARSSTQLPPPVDTDSSTTACLTKSHSQRTKHPHKRGKPHYYYFNKPVKEHEDTIKRAIVVSNKTPPADVNLNQNDEEKLPKGYDSIRMRMMRGRRRSFGSDSQAELADFFACNGVKVVSADMPPYVQIHVVDVTRKTYDSLEKFNAKTLALTLKKVKVNVDWTAWFLMFDEAANIHESALGHSIREFDGVYGPAWHCIVGSSFGSFVTHSVGGFMYFSMDQKIYVLLFKTAVQRAH
ncbi:hypothetical protein L1987_04284 [Smallanthus sonchifolius]|uniref:Uncharacterized protein n=1 Tax=Smallanthus sonchifolius TaxID=185202 RepID=A0ACB9KDA9_9ASTR|nr:hypothetical protein L1987_04284 [Smallanthus sonchifolius]